MKNILLTLLFIQTFLSTGFGQDTVQVNFGHYLSALFENTTCTYTIDTIEMEFYDPYLPPFPAQNCLPPQEEDWIFTAKFNRYDIPLDTTPGTLFINPIGGCVGFDIIVTYTDASADSVFFASSMCIDESEKEIESITITEIECGLVYIFNGQPLGAVVVNFIKTDFPILISPENEAKNQKIDTLIFDWLVSDEEEKYLFQVDTTEEFMNPFFQDLVTGGKDTIYGLEYNRDYYWRVKKSNSNAYCSDAWSDTFKFTTIVRLDIYQNIIELQDSINFRDSLMSTTGNVFEYNVAADGSLTMFIKYFRGKMKIRDFAGSSDSGYLTDSTDASGHKWKIFEAPYRYYNNKIIYIDYYRNINSLDIDYTLRLDIKPTPVVMLHGLFSNSEVWNDAKNALEADGWNTDYISTPDYQNDASFQNSATVASNALEELLSNLRGDGVFINKVSLVGHSMGGLVARRYLKNNPNTKNVSRIITLNTPHSGTILANTILDATDGFDEWLAKHVFEPVGISNNVFGDIKILNGAINSLRVDSPEIYNLNSSNVLIPSHSMSTDFTEYCTGLYVDVTLDAALEILRIGKVFKRFTALKEKREKIGRYLENAGLVYCALSELIFEDTHDGLIESINQKGGLSEPQNSNYVGDNENVFHMFSYGNIEIISDLKQLLETDTRFGVFSQNGFNPQPILPPIDNLAPLNDINKNNSLLDTIVEIAVVNLQQFDTLCAQFQPILSIEGNANTNVIFVLYFFDNDSLLLDSVFTESYDFEIPLPNNYEGNINIGILGSDGYGNTDFDTLSIFIKNSIPIEPSLEISASSVSICEGDEVEFNAFPTNGGSSPTYQWYVNSIPVGNNSSIFASSSISDGSEVYCLLTSNAECATLSVVTSPSITISVSQTSEPSLEISASSVLICEGEEVEFNAFPTNGGASPSYQWYVNGTAAGTNSSTFSSYSLSDGTQVYCEMTSSSNCADPLEAISSVLILSVNANAIPEVEITASDTSICTGDEVTFTANPTNGGNAPVYQWFVDGTPVSGNNTSYSSTFLTDGAEVYCILTSNAVCVNPISANSQPITITVSPIIEPSISISASSASICDGDEITFNATPTNGGSIPIYQWLVDGMPVGTNSSSFSSNLLINSSLVICNLTSNEECANPVEVSSNAISIEVTTLALPDLVINQDTIFATNYGSGQFNFDWYLDGSLISNEPFVICQNPGLYKLFVTFIDCTVSNTLEVQACTVSTDNLEDFNSISIFPNPANKTVTIEGRKVLERNLIIRLSNVYGQILKEQSVSLLGDWFSIELEIGRIPSGNYFIQILSEHDISAFKLIKK